MASTQSCNAFPTRPDTKPAGCESAPGFNEARDNQLGAKPGACNSMGLRFYGIGIGEVGNLSEVREKYPAADIITLLAQEKLTKAEKIMDWVVFLLTPLIDVFPITKRLNNLDKEFYLVN